MYGKPSNRQKPTSVRNKPHVKKGDTVVVLAGRDRGKQGRVLRVSAIKGTAIVERVNFLKKATRPNPQKNVQGGIVEREAPIRLSNLQLVCPSCNTAARTGSHRTADGATRFCKNCNAEIGK